MCVCVYGLLYFSKLGTMWVFLCVQGGKHGYMYAIITNPASGIIVIERHR